MALDNGYEIKLFTEFLGQTCLNIFHYEQVSGSGNATGLGSVFAVDIVSALKTVMSNQVQFKRLETKNLVLPTDFDVLDLTGTGGRTSDPMAPHDSWSFSYVTARTDTKDGGKRLVGVCEGDASGGLPTGIMSIMLQAVEAELESVLTFVAANYRPRIRGKRRGILGEFLNVISSVDFIGQYTQNTRKRNTRGIF